MRRTPEILGILSVIFGALASSLMVGVFVLVVRATPEISGPERIYGVASTVVIGALSVFLVVIGVGLLRRRRWSRIAGIWWAIVALAVNEAEFFVVGAWMHEPRTAGTFVAFVVDSIFPLALLLLLGRRSAALDFSPTGSTTPAP